MQKELQTYLENFISGHKKQKFEEVLSNRTRHITLVLEDIHQSHNASAVLRTGECFGIQDYHVIENNHKFHPNKLVVRGATKWISLMKYNKHTNNTAHCFEHLRQQGYTIVATSPHDGAIDLNEINIKQKTALVIGTEKLGLSDFAINNADVKVKVPMVGFTESFNLSVTVGICLYAFTQKLRNTDVHWQLNDDEKFFLLHEWTKKIIKRSDLIASEFFTKHGGKN